MRIQSLRRSVDTGFVPPPVTPSAAPVADVRAVPLGELLVARGAMTAEQVAQVARAQRGNGARFGETAIALGFVEQAVVDAALANQFDFAIADPAAQQLDPALVTAHGGRDRASELVRGLRANLWQELQARHAVRPAAPQVTVASMTGAVGRRVIAGNLAIAFAQAGTRTLLIDGDMRNPALHSLFRISNQSGLSTCLARRQSNPDIAQVLEIPGLNFLPAGPIPPNPAELLGRLPGLLPQLRALTGAELVLINAPPFDSADDAYLVAVAAPAVLLVTRRHFTQAGPLAAAAQRLRDAGIEIIGSVLNVA